MTENKRFVNENDGDIRDTSTMIIYYCLSLTGKELCDLLNEQEETIQNQKGYILLLEQKLEENGIRLEPKDFD